MTLLNSDNLQETIKKIMDRVPITDMHTHLYGPDFNDLLLSGIDELLTYHYLIAEFFRFSSLDYDAFFSLSTGEQADLIWETLFLQHSPVSEAQRGVLTVFQKLGLELARDLNSYREQWDSLPVEERIERVFTCAGVKEVVMTNDPFDPLEKAVWDSSGNRDARFKASLRLDRLVLGFEQVKNDLVSWGYQVETGLKGKSVEEIKRFLRDWIKKIEALYLAISLPGTFTLPGDTVAGRILEECVLPVCREFRIPLALMIGVERSVNPDLRLAGDTVSLANKKTIEYLCSSFPENKFMVTMLARENQHELTVTARKFRNLMVFGCWWFLNNPSLVEELTRMRMELLGLAFVPQHSDCRIVEQLVYKWYHAKTIIGRVLADKYRDLLDSGWQLTEGEVERDIQDLFSNNFWEFIKQ